jgi:hypothetical protein
LVYMAVLSYRTEVNNPDKTTHSVQKKSEEAEFLV